MIQTITNIDSLVNVTSTIISLQKDAEMIDTRMDEFERNINKIEKRRSEDG